VRDNPSLTLFEVAQTVLILTRSASEANKLRLPFRVKCLPRWRFLKLRYFGNPLRKQGNTDLNLTAPVLAETGCFCNPKRQRGIVP